ncbi:MAG: hypothetical protein R2861_06100 [Desulfobacterales bacterium]
MALIDVFQIFFKIRKRLGRNFDDQLVVVNDFINGAFAFYGVAELADAHTPGLPFCTAQYPEFIDFIGASAREKAVRIPWRLRPDSDCRTAF